MFKSSNSHQTIYLFLLSMLRLHSNFRFNFRALTDLTKSQMSSKANSTAVVIDVRYVQNELLI